MRAEHIAQEDKNGRNEEGDLSCAAQGYSDTKIETIFAGGGKRSRHFRGATHQGHDDESDERLAHPERFGCFLNGADKNLANQGDEDCHAGEGAKGETHRPRGFHFFA